MTLVDVVVERLEELGAQRLEHPGGTLLRHLRGSHDALERLDAPEPHRLAALCHAVYGTDGFHDSLLDPANRGPLRDLIGSDAERLVWLYSRSDQDVFTRTVADDHRFVPDRVDGTLVPLAQTEFVGLLAIWLGNELDLLRFADPAWAIDGGAGVWALLERNRTSLPDGGFPALADAVAVARSKVDERARTPPPRPPVRAGGLSRPTWGRAV